MERQEEEEGPEGSPSGNFSSPQQAPYDHPTFSDPQYQHYYGHQYPPPPPPYPPAYFQDRHHQHPYDWGRWASRNGGENAVLHEMQPPRPDFATPTRDNTSVTTCAAPAAPETRKDPDDTMETSDTPDLSISSVPTATPQASSTPLPDTSMTSMDNVPDDDNTLKNGKAKQLWTVLSATTIGRSLLKSRRKNLNQKQMETLCAFIAPHLFNIDQPFRQTIAWERYKIWLDQILAVFPSEQKENGRRFAGHEISGKTRRLKGGLVRAVNALRKRIQRLSSANGVTSVTQDVINEVIPQTEPDDIEQIDTSLESDSLIEEKIQFLKVHVEPEDKIRRLWADTRLERAKPKYQLNPFEEFSVLKTELGILLILSDFNHKYSHCCDNLSLLWAKYSTAIVAAAKEKNLKELAKFEGIPDEIAAPFMFPFLQDPLFVYVKDDKGKVIARVRPSRDASAASVIVHCENRHSLQEKIDSIVAEHEIQKLQLQPFIIIVDKLEDPETAYLVVSKAVKYPFKRLLDCLEACFKLYFTLDLKYPLFGYRFWLYVQRNIFGILLTEDKESQITEVANTIQLHLE